MPDILIRGMEMPETCNECPMYTCMHNRHDCPLHELPEHGDLIDRSEALKAMEWKWAGKAAFEAVKDVPAIVPSNKEDAK